ncbi:MAG: DNA topoisomerase, partial [Flavobacteriales bacterium]
ALELAPEKPRRPVFSEITKNASLKAIERPRQVDVDLVNAQQARRVLDRLVGFDLSPILWKRVKPGLSAGRVQSVAVRILVDREREINAFASESSFRVVGEFTTKSIPFKAELNKRFADEAAAREFLEACGPATHTVLSVETRPATRKPAPPFTTSTLQQEASRKLGFSVTRTMRVAQNLYEAGHITYMRTDSTNLSEFALSAAATAITASFGADYSTPRAHHGKQAKGAQEAHEAIRPTDFAVPSISGESDARRLYELIWKRAIASQMADARIENTTAVIDVSSRSEQFQAKGQVITFEGFLKVYLESTDDEQAEDSDKGRLPALVAGEHPERIRATATQRFTKHAPRYTEAALVKQLEELGIGRPSTYAPTIDTIVKRGYAAKKDLEGKPREFRVLTLEGTHIDGRTDVENTGAEKAKLFPTDIGTKVTDFLLKNAEFIMDYHFTAQVEEKFDVIAQGRMDWRKMLGEFYATLRGVVEGPMEDLADRILGTDPVTGKVVLVRVGRYGSLAQIGTQDDPDKRFAPLRPDQSIETITLDEALDLFKMPRALGEWNGKSVSVGIGRFGPYVRHDGLFVSIKAADGDDPFTVTLERAIELIAAKQAADANALIKVFDEDADVRVLNGRYGPYIKAGKLNAAIPKGEDAAGMSWVRAQELIEVAKAKPVRRGRARKS